MSPLSQAEDGTPKPLTRWKTWQLLNAEIDSYPLGAEEQRHPWSVNLIQRLRSPLLHGPLLRVWDSQSGSQPNGENGMLARAPDQRLDTWHARKTSLANHLDHRIRVPTPYISFLQSPSAIAELAASRSRERGPQSVTVIDPHVRLNKGLPVRNVSAEMQHYGIGIQDPCQKQSSYCRDHYVCLWEVTEEEIVSTYAWDELARRANWYEDVIMPAFCKFTKGNVSAPTGTSALNMSTMIRRLPVASEPRGQDIWYSVALDESPEPDYYFVKNNDTDADDEAEEVNWNDAITKLIEGL